MSKVKHPQLIVLSAPSGAGKSTLCRALLAARPDLVYSVSCTTRAPRGQEEDGVSYHFMSRGEFERRIRAGAFLEYAEVHGNYYGTLIATVEAAMEAGNSVLMDIDVQGAAQVREGLQQLPDGHVMKEGFVDIFINPPSLDELRSRLEGRGEDSAEVIERRLLNASGEMACAKDYRYQVVNGDLVEAVCEINSIIERA